MKIYKINETNVKSLHQKKKITEKYIMLYMYEYINNILI